MRALIVEDEIGLAEAVAAVLQKNNITADLAHDGEYGLDCALTGMYDFILLDIMLPKMDGLSVLEQLRKANITAPVLLLTARGGTGDKVMGLDAGADDYLPKPFHTDELLARLRALGRRSGGELRTGGLLKAGKADFDPHSLTLTYGGAEQRLTLKESQLLEMLVAHKEVYLSKEAIIEKLWGYDAEVNDNNVESQVSLLRKKLAACGCGLVINMARGVGYRLQEYANAPDRRGK